MVLHHLSFTEKEFKELISDEYEMFDMLLDLIYDNPHPSLVDIDNGWYDLYYLLSGNMLEDAQMDIYYHILFGANNISEVDTTIISYNKDNIKDILSVLDSLDLDSLKQERDEIDFGQYHIELINKLKDEYKNALDNDLYVVCCLA